MNRIVEFGLSYDKLRKRLNIKEKILSIECYRFHMWINTGDTFLERMQKYYDNIFKFIYVKRVFVVYNTDYDDLKKKLGINGTIDMVQASNIQRELTITIEQHDIKKKTIKKRGRNR